MEKKRTVTKAKAADGSTSRVVTRNMKDGTTKVKSKTKSEGVVTKRKVTVGKKSDKGITKVGSQEIGNRNVSYVESKSTRSVKGKETVKNLNAKKGEVRKTKSKIDGTRTMTTRNTDMSTIPTRRPTKMVGSDRKITSQGRRYMQEQNKSRGPSTVIKSRTSTKTTPAAKKLVKTKIKRMGRK